MKRKILNGAAALVCTFAVIASVILPIKPITKAADPVTEPYVLNIDPATVSYNAGGNFIQTSNFEVNDISNLGTPLFNQNGFYKWNGSTNTNDLRTVNGRPITDYYNLSTEANHTANGAKSLKSNHDSDTWAGWDFYFSVNDSRTDRLHSNTNYILTFWAKGTVNSSNDWEILYDPKDSTTRSEYNGKTWGWNMYAADGTSKYYGNIDSAEWKQYKIVFNTGNNSNNIKFRLLGTRGVVYYDDFELCAIDPIKAKVTNNNAVVQNTKNENHLTYAYDFENLGENTTYKNILWNLNPNSANYNKYKDIWSVSAEDFHGGEASLKYTAQQSSENQRDFWYTVSGLKKFTDYAFSFWANSDTANVDMLKIIRADGSTIKDYTNGDTGASYKFSKTGWQKYTYLINTGEDTELTLVLFGRTANVYWDDFCVFEAPNGIAPYITDSAAGNVLYNAEDNHITYGSFENLPDSANWGDFLYHLRDSSTSSLKNYFSVTEEAAFSGTHSLKYTGGDGGNGGFWISNDNSKKLTPKTEYVLTFRAKGDLDEESDFKILSNNVVIKDYTYNVDGRNAQYPIDSAEWKQYSYTFNSGDATDITLVLINTKNQVQYFDDFAIIEKTKLLSGIVDNNPTVNRINCDAADNLVPVPDIEGDLSANSFWSYLLNRDIKSNGVPTGKKVIDYISADNTVAHTGSSSLRYHNEEKNKYYYLPIDFKVEKYSEYAFSFWVKGEMLDEQVLGWQIHLNWESGTRDYTDINNPKSTQYKLNTQTMGEWTRYSYIIQTGSKENISFQILDNGGTMWFDNFVLFETTDTKPMGATVISLDDNAYVADSANNMIVNGDLSNSDLTSNFGTFAADTGITYGSDAIYGFGGKGGYLEYNGSDTTNGAYKMALSGLSKNTNYTLTFKYNTITAGDGTLKVGIASDSAGTAVPNTDMGNPENGMRIIGKAGGWNHLSVTFCTNTADEVWLYIVSDGNAGRVILDDFAFYLQNNGVDTIIDENINIRPGKDWYSVGVTPAGYSVAGGITSSNNLLKNADFETDTNAQWNVPTFINGAAKLTEEEAYSGKTSLKFEANGTRASSVFWVELEPRKMYVFQAMVKAYGINSKNIGDLQFGIISSKTGKFINCPDPQQTNYTIMYAYRNFTQTEQLNPNAWDGQWNNRGMYFKNDTDSVQTVGIYITATDSTVYFDDMLLTTADKFVYTYTAEDEKWETVLYGTQVENTICSDKDNLVKNGMCDSDAAWKNIRNYGKFVTVNTELKRLCYVGTGYYANYIRWFDVKPDTVYTFSVYCKGEKKGNMSFGICDNNSKGYKNIGGQQGKWVPTYDGVWYQYSTQFDTGNYTKVGFYICDGGGVADFAKIRLFESEKGTPFLESDIPPGGRVIENIETIPDVNPDNTVITEAEEDEGDDNAKKTVISNQRTLKKRKIIVQDNLWLIILIVVAVVVVAAAVILIIVLKKRKRKRQLQP